MATDFRSTPICCALARYRNLSIRCSTCMATCPTTGFCSQRLRLYISCMAKSRECSCAQTPSCSDCNLVSDLGREVAPLTSMNDAGDRKWMRSSCRIFSRSITVLLPGKQQEKRPAQLRCHTPSTPTQLEQIGAKRRSAIVPNTPSSFSRRERMSGAIGEHARASAGEEESSCTYGVKIPEEPHTGT